MKVIGLTGNIGCGKSTVAGMLRDLGVATIDADAIARQVRTNDGVARRRIEERFGTSEAADLADVVFSDPAALADLEAIVHPPVRDAVRARLAVYRRTGAPCLRCGRPIARLVVGLRSTHYCPRCQALPAGEEAES
jgi:dephospho-CoA kinase